MIKKHILRVCRGEKRGRVLRRAPEEGIQGSSSSSVSPAPLSGPSSSASAAAGSALNSSPLRSRARSISDQGTNTRYISMFMLENRPVPPWVEVQAEGIPFCPNFLNRGYPYLRAVLRVR